MLIMDNDSAQLAVPQSGLQLLVSAILKACVPPRGSQTREPMHHLRVELGDGLVLSGVLQASDGQVDREEEVCRLVGRVAVLAALP